MASVKRPARTKNHTRILQVIADGQVVRWYVRHPALPRPLCINARNPMRLDQQGARDFTIAWRERGEPFFRDLCAALMQQLGFSEGQAERMADSWDSDSAQYDRDQLTAQNAGLVG